MNTATFAIEKKQTAMQSFVERNIELLHEVHVCELCNGKYTYFNKTRHNNTKKHKDMLKFATAHISSLDEKVANILAAVAPKPRGRPKKS